MFEIERRFIVNMPIADIRRDIGLDGHADMVYWDNIEQRYLPDTGNAAIRVRKAVRNTRNSDIKHTLTMKWKRTARTSTELEHHILSADHDKYVMACGPHVLLKKRWHGFFPGFEVDQFLNPELKGLVIAEIELRNEDDYFERPVWLGEEVTGRFEYSNLALWRAITGEAPLGFEFERSI